MKNNTLKLFILLCLFLSGCSSSVWSEQISSIKSYFHNSRFIGFYSEKKTAEAKSEILQVKELRPEDYRIDSNLAAALKLEDKYPDSEKSLDEALRQIDRAYPNLSEEKIKAQFVIYFNKGVLSTEQKKIDEAIDSYQQALDLIPSSKEAKTNIELLIRDQQQQDQKNKDQKKKDDQKDQNQDQKKNEDSKDGSGQNKDNKDNKDKKDQDQDQKNQDEKDKEQDKEKKNKEGEGQDRKQSGQYKPRPFKGDQLSEGDVKKILGELSQQDKKIKQEYDKRQNKSEGRHDKDW